MADKKITVQDLVLLVMFLSGWEENSRQKEGEKVFCTWNAYPFSKLNKLSDEKLIVQFTGKKLVLLTEAGKQLAEQLKKKLKIQ
jgi:hypothetical protein